MKKKVLRFFKPFVVMLLLAVSLSVSAQQSNTVQLLQTNATDYEVKVFAPSIHSKVSSVSELSFQKKFTSISGLISVNRSQAGYFILKLDKPKAKDILQKYFQLSVAQTAILP